MTTLAEIQQKLKAPKSQFNKFGGYKYRSCEDILEAVKPLLGNLGVVISDSLVMVGDRYYVKATAKLFDEDGKIIAEVSAYAREEEKKKGMDASQITGAASSYARKYALNGLFAIDDTKDADSTNKHEGNKAIVPERSEQEFDFMKRCQKAKKVVGEEKYYECLKSHGYQHCTDVPAKRREVILSALRALASTPKPPTISESDFKNLCERAAKWMGSEAFEEFVKAEGYDSYENVPEDEREAFLASLRIATSKKNKEGNK